MTTPPTPTTPDDGHPDSPGRPGTVPRYRDAAIAARRRLITMAEDDVEPLTDDHLWALVTTEGRGTPQHPPVSVSLYSWSRTHGTPADAANAMDIDEFTIATGFFGPDDGNLSVKIGQDADVLADHIEFVDPLTAVLNQRRPGELFHPEDDFNGLDRYYALVLKWRAWENGLCEGVMNDLAVLLPGSDPDRAPLAGRFRTDPRGRSRVQIIRDVYCDGDEWTVSIIDAVNDRHDDAVGRVMDTVFQTP